MFCHCLKIQYCFKVLFALSRCTILFLGYCLPLFLRLYIVLINTILFFIIVDYCFEKTILCLEYNILDKERAPPLPLQLRPRACKRASARPACLCTLHEVPPGADALARRAKAPGEEGVRAARRGGGSGAGGGGPALEPPPSVKADSAAVSVLFRRGRDRREGRRVRERKQEKRDR